MKIFYYSVLDKVTGSFGELFGAINGASAQRRFNYVMQNSPMVSADCALYLVGEFDTDTGVFVGYDKPKFVCNYEVVAHE